MCLCSSVEETIALDDAAAKERLLRYPGGVSKLAHLAVQSKCSVISKINH